MTLPRAHLGSFFGSPIADGTSLNARNFTRRLGLPPLDGTSSVYRPSEASHWTQLGLPIPAYRFQLQEASGSVTDEVSGATMAAVGAVTYQQAGTETTYATLGVRTTDGTASMGFTATAAQLHNMLYQSVVAYLEFEVVSVPAALRSLYAFTGAASMYLGLTVSAGKAVITTRPNAPAVGTYDYADAKRHPVVVEMIAGPSVIDHATSRFRVSTDKEQITGTWAVVGNGTKGLATGGSASLTSPAVTYFALDEWLGTDAEYIANTITAKTFLQRRGWTVTGY